MNKKTKYLITGALGGLANGFFGSGGGLFLVPLFTKWTKLPEKSAFATSVAVILPLSIISAVIYFFKGALDLSGAWPYFIGGVIGGIISGITFKKVPINILRKAFALLIIYGGVRALFNL